MRPLMKLEFEVIPEALFALCAIVNVDFNSKMPCQVNLQILVMFKNSSTESTPVMNDSRLRRTYIINRTIYDCPYNE